MSKPTTDQQLEAILDELATAIHNLSPGDIGSIDRALLPIDQAKAQLQALVARHVQAARTKIATPCPACGHTSLIISADNWLVCGNLECNDPAAINTLQAQQPTGRGDV